MAIDRLKFKNQTLKNGMTFWRHEMDVPFVQISILVPVGSAHASAKNHAEQYGIAHLLEHMCLKHSLMYPKLDAFDMHITEVGGRWNAWTKDFYTEFYISLPTTTITESMLHGFLSHVFNPIFDEAALEKEKTVIANESALEQFYPGADSVSQYKFTHWMKLAAVEKAQIFGTPESFQSITTEDLSSFHTYYHSPQVQIFVGGSIDEMMLISALESISVTNQTVPTKTHLPVWTDRSYRVVSHRDIQTPVLSWGGIFDSVTLEEYWGIAFMLDYIADPDHGQLNRWVRHDKGWSYGAFSFCSVQKDRLVWIIDIPLPSENIADEVRTAIPDLVRANLRNEQGIERAIHISKARLCYEYQTLTERMDTAINELTSFGSVPSETQYVQWLEKLTPKKLEAIYDKFFAPAVTSTLLMVGDKG